MPYFKQSCDIDMEKYISHLLGAHVWHHTSSSGIQN